MWRYDGWLPLAEGEHPVTLGEGGTPLLKVERVAARQASTSSGSRTKHQSHGIV